MTTVNKREIVAVCLGFLIAPLVPAFFLPLATPLVVGPEYPSFAAAHIAFFYTACFAAEIIIALPAFLLLRRFRLVRWWSAALTGALIGFAYALVIGGVDAWYVPLSWVAAGTVGALLFWCTWHYGQRIAQQGTPADRPATAKSGGS